MSRAWKRRCAAVFPIRDFAGTSELDFVHYELEDPKYDVDRMPPARHHLRRADEGDAAPDRVRGRPDTETRSVLDIKEQDVYMGDMPLMTENGTFIINGTERVIVARCTVRRACCSIMTAARPTPAGKYLFAARVIPYRGSWLDFEFDAKDIVNVRIDRKRKLPVTALLYALGLNARKSSTTSTTP
jgi:DNA-directed RNA polymerase subunit beta